MISSELTWSSRATRRQTDMASSLAWLLSSNPTHSYFGANYTQAIHNGSVPEWRLTDVVVRILTPSFSPNQYCNYSSVNLNDDPRKTITNAQRQRHRMVACDVAAAGTVRLKNTPGKRGHYNHACSGPRLDRTHTGPINMPLGPACR